MTLQIIDNLFSKARRSKILVALVLVGLATGVIYYYPAQAADALVEPVQACVFASDLHLNPETRARLARCLEWEAHQGSSICQGFYRPIIIQPLADKEETQISADNVSFYPEGRSDLSGHVEVRQAQRIVNAQTAYVYRDANTKQVTKIELLDNVRYLEPGRMMLASKATINPNDKSGHVENVVYRFDVTRAEARLPAWGRASLIERFANQNLLLKKATYSTCAPQDRAWQIEADEINLNQATQSGVANNALLRIADWPVLYTPYMSFPTTNARKSGFLLPIYGYSNVGGFDLALPYYWNIAPNMDATITPHEYSLRGTMIGGEARFLTSNSAATLAGNFLPHDRAYSNFLTVNQNQYPWFKDAPTDRWSFMVRDSTQFSPNLQMNINYQQVSDDYYLQDFSSNLAILTENQLLRQGDLTYTTDHWLFAGMLQSYQTLHPINQSAIADVYERLPQLKAQGHYDELPLNAHFSVLGQFDNFHWTNTWLPMPQGPRYHLNPVLSLPMTRSWGYVTPEVQLVENYYDLHSGSVLAPNTVNRTIPRFSVDSGLILERNASLMGHGYTQTLEPRLFYLNVPYHNQSVVPAFESAYMIFYAEQLFRTNRFSGFDRIGDANQLAYALKSRWISDNSGRELASVIVGQLTYFKNRQVKLCYSPTGNCVDDPQALGFLSPNSKTSPIASQGTLALNSAWGMSGDYVWDPYTQATNNGDLNLHYRPAENKMFNIGYSYLVAGNIIEVKNDPIVNRPLHQATFSYAWPLTETVSTLGAYSYNISEAYNMMAFAGLQYDTCCWAFRLLGGQTFKSLGANGSLEPRYNNNVYFQVLLKGLGSAALSDPATIIQTYLPGYPDIFHR